MFTPLKLAHTIVAHVGADASAVRAGNTVQTLDNTRGERDGSQSKLGVHRRRAHLDDGRSAHVGHVVRDGLARFAGDAEGAADAG